MKVLYPFLLILCLVCCRKEEKEPEILLPATPIMTGTISWGVVNVPYLKAAGEPGDEQHIVTTLRFGDIVEITAARYLPHKRAAVLWYQVRQPGQPPKLGWVQDQYLEGYATMEKAKTASALLLEP